MTSLGHNELIWSADTMYIQELNLAVIVPTGALSNTGLIQGLHPANERRCYNVTPSLIGSAQT